LYLLINDILSVIKYFVGIFILSNCYWFAKDFLGIPCEVILMSVAS